jgi:hypothetical protein
VRLRIAVETVGGTAAELKSPGQLLEAASER